MATEYQRQTLPRLACGAPTSAAWPPAMPAGEFGPPMHATTAYLTGRLGNSQRVAQQALTRLFHLDVSLGSIPALEQMVSAALATPVAAAQAYVQQQPSQNVDDTRKWVPGWREGNARCWPWVSTTAWVTVFLALAKGGAAEAEVAIGQTYAGIVGSDRHTADGWLDPQRRQVCLAHL